MTRKAPTAASRPHHRLARLVLAAALPAMLMMLIAPARAQTEAELAARQVDRRAEYESLVREITVSSDRRAELAAEIAAIEKDHASITAALIESAKVEKKLSEEIAAIEARLDELRVQEDAIRRSLSNRRAVLAEVLGALQRMGLDPPPAILVSPDDALSSVRSAILLGAVVPELRSETEILIADLKELARVMASIEDERDKLAHAVVDQVAEKEKLTLLLDEKRRLRTESETVLAEEDTRATELAARAESLMDLIETLEVEINKMRSAREEAIRAEKERRDREAELASLPVPEANRLVKSAPFEQLRGAIGLPATGVVAHRFGDSDGAGSTRYGDTVRTQSGAIVTAPADGVVLYAGPFRSYGQLLILNAGDGYHIVLAGLGRINVSLGQSVLAGEPVGAMDDVRLASAGDPENGKTGAELYVEFRKDGKPVDPAPWWVDRNSGRTGNDT